MVYIVVYLDSILQVFGTNSKAENFIRTIAPYDRGSYTIVERRVR